MLKKSSFIFIMEEKIRPLQLHTMLTVGFGFLIHFLKTLTL
jgi:hypothetical protein